jgi:hypothetical protein
MNLLTVHCCRHDELVLLLSQHILHRVLYLQQQHSREGLIFKVGKVVCGIHGFDLPFENQTFI